MKRRTANRPTVGAALVAGALIACALVIGGCGSSSGSSDSSGGSTAAQGGGDSSGGDSAAVKTAEQKINTALAPPTFKASGPAFDMGSAMKGKTVWFIAATMETPYLSESAAAFTEAAEYAGATVKVYDGKAETSVQAAGIEEAVSTGADLIFLQAVDPKLMATQIKEAASANIPVLDGNNYEPGSSPSYGSWIHTGYSTEEQGALGIDYAIAKSGGEFHALFVTSPFFVWFEQRQKAMEAELEKVCPEKCSMTVQKVEFSELAQTPLKIQSELTQDSSIDWIIPAYETLVPYILQGLKTAGKQGEVSVENTGGGAAEELKAMADGSAEYDTLITDYPKWDGWNDVDLAGRALAGEPAPDPYESYPPLRLFTAEHPPKVTSGNFMEVDFIGDYKKLWEGL